jgi:hypothetical protein
MDDFAHVQMETQSSSVTLGLTLMLESCKDLSLEEVSGAQV